MWSNQFSSASVKKINVLRLPTMLPVNRRIIWSCHLILCLLLVRLIISSPSLKLHFILHKFFSASLSPLYWSTLSSGMSWFELSLWWHVTFSYCMCLTRCNAMLAANITDCEWVLLLGQFAAKRSWESWFQSMCSLNCIGIREILHYREI